MRAASRCLKRTLTQAHSCILLRAAPLLAEPPLDIPAAPAPDRYKALLRWAETQGLETLLRPAMLEYPQKGGGVVRARGMVATRAIKKGEVLVGCPRSIVLSGEGDGRLELGPAAKEMNGWDALVLLLMTVRAKLELAPRLLAAVAHSTNAWVR